MCCLSALSRKFFNLWMIHSARGFCRVLLYTDDKGFSILKGLVKIEGSAHTALVGHNRIG
ncbi:hypothetical protein BH09BAC1_BH09BAC1_30300 [soil metagenome]